MPSRNNSVSAETLHQLYWVERLSLEGVAGRLGISTSGADNLMKRHGIPKRGRPEAYENYLRRVARQFAAEEASDAIDKREA